ncbi:MAG: ABC transporter permease [Egibacteraceae bacterium]
MPGRGLLRRLTQAAFTILGASVLIWALLPLAPGDPAVFVLTARGNRTPVPSQIEAVRVELGLDDPWMLQYGKWLAGLTRGELGNSYRTGKPVTADLVTRALPTLRLAAAAVALGAGLSLVAGLVSAAFAGRWPDHLIRLYAAAFASIPSFVLGIVLLQIVVVWSGRGSVVADAGWGDVWLPAACLAAPIAARWIQILRVGLLEAAGAGYHLVVAARGAGPARLLLVHALPNALLPFMTAVGLGIVYFLTGTAVIEAVFTWPGLGLHLLHAVRDRDLPVIQAIAVLATVGFVGMSMLVDAIARLIDPRVGDRMA